MAILFVSKDEHYAMRLATHGSASMLMRFVDVPLDDSPVLRWQSLIGQGIVSELDERTGD
jgi:hypothetical protein